MYAKVVSTDAIISEDKVRTKKAFFNDILFILSIYNQLPRLFLYNFQEYVLIV